MNAQFWLYLSASLLGLCFVWGVVDVLGSGLLRAYRRYQVRKEFK
jgi:ABC-type siderophore export system fused ATPase/permease subunit